MSVAILAEKPSVARDIARVVGAQRRGDGHLHGNGYVVCWAIGHLVALPEPHQIRPEWKRWRSELLPMLPAVWPLEVYPRTRDQFEIVSRILNDPEVSEVVCATDAGREGELIFRYIYEAAACRKPVRRLWISSLTESAIRAGLENLRTGDQMNPLADAARGRSRADWLVGMNLSRAYTLVYGDTLSVGRVQTPTLAMLVERELAIRDFVPEDYKEVVATFSLTGEDACELTGEDARESTGRYDGVYFDPTLEAMGETRGRAEDPADLAARRLRARRLPADGEQALQILERAQGGLAVVKSVEARQRVLPPPLLYDLTELQRHANRLYAFSATTTLELAQSLYERKKLISYPRTDSRHLPRDIERELPGIVAAIQSRYAPEQLAEGAGERPLGSRFVDDRRVSDHHAILPTTTDPGKVSLDRDEARIYDLVCRRLLAAWHEDHLYSTTRVVTLIRTQLEAGDSIVDPYQSSGTRVDREGWKVVDIKRPKPVARSAEAKPPSGAVDANLDQDLPSGLREGLSVEVQGARIQDKRTRPPRRFSDATLLTAMETAGKSLDEKELSDAMRKNGLGTPATRASIIETLLTRGYALRDGKSFVATNKGIRLIEVVHPDVKSPIMTGRWEARLQDIQRGTGRLDGFMTQIEAWVGDVTRRVLERGEASREAPGCVGAPPPTPPRLAAPIETEPIPPEKEPIRPEKLDALLHSRFGFEDFRPHQRDVCEAVTRGEDVLLVMPTGAGKSLCYQLPGIARAGTTLVVSPLIALMEDQVAKLQDQGFRAERIHSGRSRSESRQVCVDYLKGDLHFLFIAPERLSVAGFPEMLAKRKPVLIAVDEAHCISQWGHDFRPDYRMLRDRLRPLRPAPVLAMTATATPRVQRDIVEQLGNEGTERFIHGFRRSNIAIEVVELTPAAREEAALRILKVAAQRPAIVYAPTRKKAESLAALLAQSMPCAVYHAGIGAATRDRVQVDFLGGRLDVIVATIAFGMGIDKADVRTVIHTALPGSVEGYYQEIGRAGRDGLRSRAILLHSFADRKTHEWFLERDYPEPQQLERVFDALDETPRSSDAVQQRISGRRMGEESFEKALEKLWIHGGARVSPEGNACRGVTTWREAYLAQRRHKEEQLADVARFSESAGCRMLHLVRHFGDQEDAGALCGTCDVCAPTNSIGLTFRTPTPTEREALSQILKALRERNGPSTGRLHQNLFGDALERKRFESLLTALVRGGMLTVEEDSFENEGREIRFRRAFLTPAGRGADDAVLSDLSLVDPPTASRRRKRASQSTKNGGRGSGKGARRRGNTRPRPASGLLSQEGGSSELVRTLKQWRLEKAKRRRIPAFRILTDRTLLGIATATPRDEEGLLAVKGMGPKLVKKYGREILEMMGVPRV